MIQCYRLPGEFPRITPVQRGYQRSNAYTPGCQRDSGERDPRIRNRIQRSRLDVVPHEASVPCGILRLSRQVGEQARIAVRVKCWEADTEAHTVLPSTLSDKLARRDARSS